MTSSLASRRWPRERADLALTVLVVAVVAMMVVPLPTALVDLFIALNLTLGVLLLATALYLRDATSFAAFPTVILLATLYRLALNVSSTRLILLQADAGRVIESFGKFVVRGDYIVGALVFALITIVQFLVIAKGAERVAEVGARFSLDAMPGKQMAIDGELRAGTITAESARARRRALERESQLYGAMDGAMKFVKGDAIAGIIITLVNFLGGVGVGVLSRGMPVKTSLATYGLLTIGDGLVTQIPALLCATAAGLVVTRVSSDDGERSLASDIAQQLLSDRRVLGAAALVLALLAIVPGLPAWPFALMALVCGGLLARIPAQASTQRREDSDAHVTEREHLALVLGPELGSVLAPRGVPSPELERALEAVRSQVYSELGVELVRASVRVDPSLAPRAFRLVWRELPQPSVIADEAPLDTIVSALEVLVMRRAEDLVGLEQVQRMLDALEREQPALVRHTVPRPVSPALLAQVLRLLVRERVTVRWLPEVLDAIAEHAGTEARPHALAEHARRALARRISQSLAPAGTLHALRLSPEVEEALSDAVRRDGADEYLALAPDLAHDIVHAARAAHTRAPRPHALVTSPALRRHVRGLLAESAPDLAVVSAYELAPELSLTQGEHIGP